MPLCVHVGPGTGVPFHIHGPTFAETIYGRKVTTTCAVAECIGARYFSHAHYITNIQRWFLYPPDVEPQFHPDINTLHWLTHTYPTLTQQDRPWECTLSPGEVSNHVTVTIILFCI